MMPDLGKYTAEVLLAYGATGLLLAALLIGSVLQSRRVKRALDQAEARRKDG